MNNYYLVTAKCGHVGKRYYVPITYPVVAESKKIAAKVVRHFPRVKHNHKDAILDVKRCTEDEYFYQLEINKDDEYLHIGSRHEQNLIWDSLLPRLEFDSHSVIEERTSKQESRMYRYNKARSKYDYRLNYKA